MLNTLKRFWFLLCMFLLVICLTAGSVAIAEEGENEETDEAEAESSSSDFEEFLGSIIQDSVNVRVSPTVNSEKEDVLKYGDVVTVFGLVPDLDESTGKKWYHVKYGDENKLRGYVRSDLIQKGRVRTKVKYPDLLDKLAIPERDRKYFLQPTLVNFKEGRKFAVYTGPGADYVRGDDIAVVSTNGKVQVFGTDGEWALVQYSILGRRLRIGYISKKHIPEEYLVTDKYLEYPKIHDLEFEYKTVRVKEDVGLTDDPLLSQNSIVELTAGTVVTRLGYLEGWAYVEYFSSENRRTVKARGFIRSSLLEDLQ